MFFYYSLQRLIYGLHREEGSQQEGFATEALPGPLAGVALPFVASCFWNDESVAL